MSLGHHFFRTIVFVLVTTIATLSMAQSNSTTVIKHYDKGYSPLLRVYLTEVLRLVLDKTVMEYGPYEIEFYSNYLSANRSKIETERGELIHLLFSPFWRGQFVNPENVIHLEFPVFSGLLGLRNLIVNGEAKSIPPTFASQDPFRSLTAGQGANWIDSEILKGNGIQVVESQLFPSLFPMLAKNRFDYIPLSILEAEIALQTQSFRHQELKLHPEVMVFYPLPFSLYVHKSKPELAKRLSSGLTVATADGSLARLFGQHFGHIKEALAKQQYQLILLQTPFLNQTQNRHYTQTFIQIWGEHFTTLP